jgi:hypothetical protein
MKECCFLLHSYSWPVSKLCHAGGVTSRARGRLTTALDGKFDVSLRKWFYPIKNSALSMSILSQKWILIRQTSHGRYVICLKIEYC